MDHWNWLRDVICRRSAILHWQSTSWESRRQLLPRTKTRQSRLRQKWFYWWLKHSEMHRITRRQYTYIRAVFADYILMTVTDNQETGTRKMVPVFGACVMQSHAKICQLPDSSAKCLILWHRRSLHLVYINSILYSTSLKNVTRLQRVQNVLANSAIYPLGVDKWVVSWTRHSLCIYPWWRRLRNAYG